MKRDKEKWLPGRGLVTFDQWFDTTYGDMGGVNICLLLSFKEVAQKAWDAALENDKAVSVPYGLRDLTKQE